jgi:hypothetical protein
MRKRDFVRFEPAPTSEATQPERLLPKVKLAVYATGELAVDQKLRRFSMLPGFYRTFANGDHVLMCLARGRAMFSLPAVRAEEWGMWYAFIPPASVQSVRFGLLHHRRRPLAAIALTYQPCTNAGNRRKVKPSTQTMYIVCANADELIRLHADLLWQVSHTSTHAAVRSP